MANYLCQDCKSNNNGWCTVRKCNGLKKLNITSCNTYEDKNTIELNNGNKITPIEAKGEVVRGKRAELKMLDDKIENNNEAYRVLGKREMLWHIQSQIVGINEDNMDCEEKFRILVDCIKSLGTHLEFEEKLWEVENILDSEIDRDMIEDSKYINKNLL